METISFKLSGLTCGACVKLASMSIKKIDGVIDVNVDENSDAKVIAERIIEKEEVKKALAGTDFNLI